MARVAVRPLGDIEDHSMGVELRRGIAVYGTRGVMLELCSNKLAAILGGIVAADTRLRVALQLL